MRFLFLPILLLALPFDVISEEENSGTQHNSRIVNAVGFAEVSEQMPHSETHRLAVKDALKNALLMAHSQVNLKASTRNMRIENETITVTAGGKIINSHLVSHSYIGTDPKIYQVTMKVLIVPTE